MNGKGLIAFTSAFILGLAALIIASHLMYILPPDYLYSTTPQLIDSVRYNWAMVLYILGGILIGFGAITSIVLAIVGEDINDD